MKLYAAIDLHSSNNFLCIINEKEQIVYKKRLPNDLEIVKKELMQEVKPN